MVSRRDTDDPSSDSDDAWDSAEERRRSRRSSRHAPVPPAKRRGPVRRWRASEENAQDEADDELEPAEGQGGLFHRAPRPTYWRARDSLYFEPLVAVAIIVVMLVSLYAYTSNWPPVYVVESDSMQHGPDDVLGVINTGDLVLAQRVSSDQITPYVVGLQTGYSTYGEYGDVILYLANGQGSTPVVHRALLYLQWDPATSSYNASDLANLRCGNVSGAVFSTPGTMGPGGPGCGTTGLTGTLNLFHVGWQSVEVSVDLSSAGLGRHSGFLTMGDNNLEPNGCTSNCQSGLPDQVDGTSELVEPGWIVGVARGMLPWFGALKLLLEGSPHLGEVPPQSWQFMGLTVVGLILLAFGIHYALRAEGVEDERRKEEEAAAEAESEDEARGESRGRRLLRAIRPWGRSDHTEDDEEDEVTPRTRPARGSRRPAHGHRGRPPPKVRRGEKSQRKNRDQKDDDL